MPSRFRRAHETDVFENSSSSEQVGSGKIKPPVEVQRHNGGILGPGPDPGQFCPTWNLLTPRGFFGEDYRREVASVGAAGPRHPSLARL